MGHIEDMMKQRIAEDIRYKQDRAADAEYAAMQRQRKEEAAKVLNQGEVGLSGSVAQIPYANGISTEDAQKLVLAQQAQKANEYRTIQDMISKNRDYNATKGALAGREAAAQATFDAGGDVGGNGDIMDFIAFNPIDKAAVQKYQDSVDQGLAAKWMQSYKGR